MANISNDSRMAINSKYPKLNWHATHPRSGLRPEISKLLVPKKKHDIYDILYRNIYGIKLYCRMRSKAGSRFVLRFWRLIERVSLKVCQTSCNHPQPFAAVCKCHIGVPLVEAAKRWWIMTFTVSDTWKLCFVRGRLMGLSSQQVP